MRFLKSLASLGFLAGCAAETGQQGSPPRIVQAGETFDLHSGELVALRDTPYVLMFDAAPDDSRCPRDVSCVWEGNARVNLTLREYVPWKKSGGPLYEVVDNNVELNSSARFPQRQQIPGGVLVLRGLQPQAPAKGGPYTASLSYEVSP